MEYSAMLLQNYIAGFSTLIIDVIMYFTRVPKEEQMMIDQFGEEYRECMKQTGRLFPKNIMIMIIESAYNIFLEPATIVAAQKHVIFVKSSKQQILG
jgi:hypothetical protein